MSAEAARFYQAGAKELDLLPAPIFDGRAHGLLPGDYDSVGISVLRPSEAGKAAVQKLAEILRSVESYAMARQVRPPERYDKRIMRENQEVVANVVGSLLLPPKDASGRLSNLTIEALAPQELLLPGMIAALGNRGRYCKLGPNTAHAVFFVVSGMFRKVHTSYPCFGSIAVFADSHYQQPLSPRYLGAKLGPRVAAKWQRMRADQTVTM